MNTANTETSVEKSESAPDETSLFCAILFSAGGTIEYERLEEHFGWSDDEFEARLAEARGLLAAAGLTIIEVAGGFKMVTLPEAYEPLKAFFSKVKETGLSKAALETLSVIAYKQPCTRSDVEEIRGVNSDGVIRGLLEKRLIKVKERTDTPGRPFTYVTTAAFLELFGMKSLKDLPRVEGLDNFNANGHLDEATKKTTFGDELHSAEFSEE